MDASLTTTDRRRSMLGAFIATALVAFGAFTSSAWAQDPIPGRGGPPGTEGVKPRAPGDFAISSKAFGDNTRIPDKFTVEGADLSPPLAWTGAPAGTKSFAIICEDLDTPNKPWVHWVIYGLSGDLTELPEGIKRERDLTEPIVAKQGITSWPKDNTGWRGPATPRGDKPHRYRFTIYALKAPPDAKSGLNAEVLRKKMQDLSLGEATITGTYSRARKAGETPPGEQAPEKVPGATPPTPPTPPGSKPADPAKKPADAPPASKP